MAGKGQGNSDIVVSQSSSDDSSRDSFHKQLSSITEEQESLSVIENERAPRKTEIPSSVVLKTPVNQSTSQIDSLSEKSKEEDEFDEFILSKFRPFSGKEDVIDWLDETDEKFDSLKISRNRRFQAIPLLVKAEGKRIYINHKHHINSYDDFYAMLLQLHTPSALNPIIPPSNPLPQTINVTHINSVPPILRNVTFDNQISNTSISFDDNDSLPIRPILRSTALPDYGAAKLSGDEPVFRSNPSSSQTTFFSSNDLDQTAYALRRAIVDSLIKNPKTFRGGKDDLKLWLEDLEQLFDTAQIPDSHKLDLVQYSLRGEALRWFKNNKCTLTTWNSFINGIKETFLSPFFEEVAFKKLESYIQGLHQPIHSFYNEIIKLCAEADPSMSESTKLRNLLNKTKPLLQFEIRKKKPSTTKQFLKYAIEVEELYHLSNLDLSTNSLVDHTLDSSTSSSRSNKSNTIPDHIRSPPMDYQYHNPNIYSSSSPHPSQANNPRTQFGRPWHNQGQSNTSPQWGNSNPRYANSIPSSSFQQSRSFHRTQPSYNNTSNINSPPTQSSQTMANVVPKIPSLFDISTCSPTTNLVNQSQSSNLTSTPPPRF